MSGRLHHVGLVVADLGRSLAFYRDLIGLAPRGRGVESDPRYAAMLGVPQARFAWAELDLGDGHVLELLRFDEPSDEAAGRPGASSAGGAPPGGAGSAPRDADRPERGAGLPGLAHFGITVEDIEAVHDALVKGGATVISRPIELVEENEWLGARVFYALDPDGHLIELIQPAAPADRGV